MKRIYLYIALPLFISLFIYLFYRTDKTVINVLINNLTQHRFAEWKSIINTKFPFPNFVIYSLPEGLWIFAATLLSKPFYLKISTFKIELFYLPISYALGLEILQLLHIWNGVFDANDIIFSLLFFGIALSIPLKYEKINLAESKLQILPIASIYAIVFLSHVNV